ncbi:IucA/IucC family protein [Macrococcus equi]|uniref:IucA/IucC family protein n=1 Tax=Macrococcus equi TaxID=3395462 RepID=UPI0039BDF42B
MKKIINAIVQECISPFTKVKDTSNEILLYTNETVVSYDKATCQITIGDEVMTDPLNFLEWCGAQSEYNYNDFIKEIENHLINQALSFIHCAQVEKSHHPLLTGEQWVVTGHNIHPCAKTKLGMSFEEVMRYAPEYNQVFELNWILVKKTLLFNNLETIYINQLKAFSGYDKPIDEKYTLIPVHPFQYQHVLNDVYQEEIATGDIVMLDYKGGVVKSTSSFRTVCPLDSNYPIIKLPVHAQMTSTVRSISNNSVINSKKISDYIEGVYNNDIDLKKVSTPIMEYGGMTYPHDDERKQRNLSFILRENSTQKFKQFDKVYTATCLCERDETGQKIYQQLIAHSQMSQDKWFEKYATLLIDTAVPLMTKYGIGLEAHMQNISIAFCSGIPTHIYYRDFGGLRIDVSRTHGKLQLKQGLTHASTVEMHEKLLNTLLANHLETLIVHFSEDYQLSSTHLWAIVASAIDKIFATFEEDIPWFEQDCERFKSPYLKQKALMTMRLSTSNKDIYIEKENPLYASFVKQ